MRLRGIRCRSRVVVLALPTPLEVVHPCEHGQTDDDREAGAYSHNESGE